MDYERITSIVWIVFLGICFGAFYAYYNKKLLGDIVRAIVFSAAENEQTAKTLEELGYGSGIKKLFAKHALRKGSGLRKTVCVLYEEKTAEKKNEDELFAAKTPLPGEQRYYIPEESRIRAEVRYDDDGTTATAVLATVAAFFVVALISISVLPTVIRYFGGLFSERADTTSYNTDSGYSSEITRDESSVLEEQ